MSSVAIKSYYCILATKSSTPLQEKCFEISPTHIFTEGSAGLLQSIIVLKASLDDIVNALNSDVRPTYEPTI